MSVVKLARQASSQTEVVWEGKADTEKNQLVIRYGKRGGTLRMKVVPSSCFTEFNAELELEYRATKRREAGYVDEIDSDSSPQPSAPATESPWPTLYAAPLEAFKQRRKETVKSERRIAESVMTAFELSIPPEWSDRPRVIEPGNDYALPMLVYALGACRSGAIGLADDTGKEISPVRFAEHVGLAELDPRVPALMADLGLVSVRQAMAIAEPDTADAQESEWFF